MTLMTITQKVLGSDTYAEKKLLATDMNQIREAIQTGLLDIKPNNIAMEGNKITADGGQNWIRRSSNKFQFYDAGTWKEPTTLETATFTAGEAISIRDVVYINTSDGKIYKASSSNSDWIGVAKEAITSAATGEVYLNNSIVGGFSSLTPGNWYGLNVTAGTITANENYIVGIALSATQIHVIKPKGRDSSLYKLQGEKAINDVSETNSGVLAGSSQVLIDKFLNATGQNNTVDTSNTDANYIGVSYDNKSFDVSTQDYTPEGLFFKPDGTKVYVVGLSNKFIYQYSLSTAWDISTASYDSKSFSVSSQETAPQGLFFKSDGTKVYIVGSNNNTIYQYTLSTAWDISTATYDSKSFSVASQENSTTTLYFKSDGQIACIIGYGSDTVYQYSLSTAWDISTASYTNKSFYVGTQCGMPVSLFFNEYGTIFYVSDYYNKTVYQYSLLYWDVSTARYDNKHFSVKSQTNRPASLFFKSDGTKCYVPGLDTKIIYQYSLSTAWDIEGICHVCKAGSGVSFADSTLQSNSFTIPTDATKVFVTPYKAEELETGDTITADVSTDNGSTYSTDIAVNEWVDISSLTNSGTAIVKMNLRTNTGATTPKVKGWRLLLE